jgi:hypothetical protein
MPPRIVTWFTKAIFLPSKSDQRSDADACLLAVIETASPDDVKLNVLVNGDVNLDHRDAIQPQGRT